MNTNTVVPNHAECKIVVEYIKLELHSHAATKD